MRAPQVAVFGFAFIVVIVIVVIVASFTTGLPSSGHTP
jgi:hypothetical protein